MDVEKGRYRVIEVTYTNPKQFQDELNGWAALHLKIISIGFPAYVPPFQAIVVLEKKEEFIDS